MLFYLDFDLKERQLMELRKDWIWIVQMDKVPFVKLLLSTNRRDQPNRIYICHNIIVLKFTNSNDI